MAISAAFTVNGAANPAAHIFSYGSTITLALVSTAGVERAEFTIESSSKSGTAIPALTPGGTPLGATATFDLPADPADNLGRSFLVKCTVYSQYNTAVQAGVVGAANAAGLLPISLGEELTRDGTHGWLEALNTALAAQANVLIDDSTLQVVVGTTAQATTESTDAALVVRPESRATVADLRGVNPVAGRTYLTASYAVAGDRGGGTFRAVTGEAAATYVDNGGDIIVPTSGPSSDGSGAFLLVNDVINVRQFGAGQGGDDTAAINTVWTRVQHGSHVVFPPGAYNYAATTAVNVQSRDDITIEHQEGSTVTITGTALSYYHAFYYKVCDRITIKGPGKIIGRTAVVGSLIYLEGSLGATIDRVKLRSAGSDCIYVTRATSNQATNHVIHADIDGAGRNGISVISCDGIEIDGDIRNVAGDPGAGIQFEPNNYVVDLVTNAKVNGITVVDCQGNGVAVSGQNKAIQSQQGIGTMVISNATTKGCGTSAVTGRESGISVTFAHGVQVINHVSRSDRVGFRSYLAHGLRYKGRIESSTSTGCRIQDTNECDIESDSFKTGGVGIVIDGFSRGVKLRGSARRCTGNGVSLNSGTSECDVAVNCKDNTAYGIASSGAGHRFAGCDLRSAGASGGLSDTGYGSITDGSNLSNAQFGSSDLTTWTADQVTVTGGQADPFGGTTAYNVVDTVDSGSHRIYTTPTSINASADAVYEFYAKANTVATAAITMDGGSNVVNLDLATGAITGTAVNAKASGPLGDGWYAYRIVFPNAKISGAANSVQFYLPAGVGTVQGVLIHKLRVTQ